MKGYWQWVKANRNLTSRDLRLRLEQPVFTDENSRRYAQRLLWWRENWLKVALAAFGGIVTILAALIGAGRL